jgi:antitoxin (DNA-binding transcriptional repressor) of toxin-antitoxin stability system
MQTVQIEEAQAHLAELIEGIGRAGELVIARGSRPVAKLVVVEDAPQQPRFGSARGKIQFAEGWDGPTPGFEEYQSSCCSIPTVFFGSSAGAIG